METRKIVVVNTRTQSKKVINSSANTLAELKADLNANRINYDDMAFYEGVSKVELKDDSSVLPHDIPYKGQVTNDLVIMLTNSEKKIASGAMSRKEAFAVIKERNLQEAIKAKTGASYSNLPTEELVNFINSTVGLPTSDKDVKISEETKSPCKEEPSLELSLLKDALTMVIDAILENDVLYEDNILYKAKNLLNGENIMKEGSPYSENDIDDMLSTLSL